MLGAEVPDPLVSAMLTFTVMLLVAGLGALVRVAMIISEIQTTQEEHDRRLTEVERRVDRHENHNH